MMFFFGINEDASFYFKRETLSLLTKDRFLNSITVNAVLVGSSNQSKTTYYGGASDPPHEYLKEMLRDFLSRSLS